MIAAQLLRMSYAQILSQCFLHLTRHHSLFEHKQKTALCAVLVFVVVCGLRGPASIQHAARCCGTKPLLQSGERAGIQRSNSSANL